MVRTTQSLCLYMSLLVFQCLGTDGANVVIDVSKAPDLQKFAQGCKYIMEFWFNSIAEFLKSPNDTPPQTMYLHFEECDGFAGADAFGARITGCAGYYRVDRGLDDYGSMIHEMAHVIQRYRDAPGWVAEGIAEYIRAFYYNWEGVRNVARKPGVNNEKWRNGYGDAAYFLNYVRNNVRNDIIYWVNKDAREGTYNDNIWPKLTGKSLDQLWDEMMSRG